MKSFVTACLLSALSLGAQALPKVGYYKTFYPTAGSSYDCTRIVSNTSTVTVSGKSVTYFQMKLPSAKVLNCIPLSVVDTDDASEDGTATGTLFVSSSQAFCTATDGTLSVPLQFDSTHLFWGGESSGKVTLPDGKTAWAPLRERQSSSSTYYGATACP